MDEATLGSEPTQEKVDEQVLVDANQLVETKNTSSVVTDGFSTRASFSALGQVETSAEKKGQNFEAATLTEEFRTAVATPKPRTPNTVIQSEGKDVVLSGNETHAEEELPSKNSLGDLPDEHEAPPPPKVSKYWQVLRDHVKKGIYAALLNPVRVQIMDFSAHVDKLWTLVNTYSGKHAASWSAVSATAGRRLSRVPDRPALSLDAIPPDVNIHAALKQLSDGLATVGGGLDADAWHVQQGFQRAWKLLILGLEQEESFARYLALLAIRKAVPVINETLFDGSTRENLVSRIINIMITDERFENRLKSIYLLGVLGTYLGANRENEDLTLKAYNELSKQMLEVQLAEKKAEQSSNGKFAPNPMQQQKKIYLMHALGRFIRHTYVSKEFIENLLLYFVHEEFEYMRVAETTSTGEDAQDPLMNPRADPHLIKVMLSILNNDVKKSDLNRTFMGAMFKRFIHPLMRSKRKLVQALAVQFISGWLPITHERASIIALDVLVNGVKQAKSLNTMAFTNDKFEAEMKKMTDRRHNEDARMAIRNKLLHEILSPPGTTAKLMPVDGYPGYFVETNSTMLNTMEIVVNLPIHPQSLVSLSRPIPSIPGVPVGTTTTPPLFVDANFQFPAVQTMYEFYERSGLVVGLPPGYSHSPQALVPFGANLANVSMGKHVGLQRVSVALPRKSAWIPTGTSRIPPKTDLRSDMDPSKVIPYGFLPDPPVAGHEGEEVDRHVRQSVIYDETRTGILKSVADVPAGCTTDRNPVLFPCRDASLKTTRNGNDFPMNAPVLFDIIQPETLTLQRILTKVIGINRELSAVAIADDAIASGDRKMLSVGASFNIFIRSRHTPEEWISVHLEVVDDSYTDDIPKSKNTAVVSSVVTSLGGTIHVPPLPAGLTGNEDPYYAPPFNFPPVPVGYTSDGTPFYGKTPSMKSMPYGLTTYGKKFYLDKPFTLEFIRNYYPFAGFNHVGRPIFVPRGHSLPVPSGYTPDGIPYYDLTVLANQRGRMVVVIPSSHVEWYQKGLELLKQSSEEEIDGGYDSDGNADLSTSRSLDKLSSIIPKKCLNFCDPFQPSKALSLIQLIENGRPYLKNSFLRQDEKNRVVAKKDGSDPFPDLDWNPFDPMEFFRQSDNMAFLKPNQMKMLLDPSFLEFQSVHAVITKSILLKYRAGRGDHSVRDYFISVTPPEIFSVNNFHFQLQGEGMVEILVSYYPSALAGLNKTTGSVEVMDDMGKKISSCHLTAHRQPFIKAYPTIVDAGWTLPGRHKQSFLRVENISLGPIVIEFFQKSVIQAKAHAESLAAAANTKGDNPSQAVTQPLSTETPSFVTNTKPMRLLPSESKVIPVTFHPSYLGRHTDTLTIAAPGGDFASIQLAGNSGLPLAVYPEDETQSAYGAAELTRERCDFMYRFRMSGMSGGRVKDRRSYLRKSDTDLLKRILAVTSSDLNGSSTSQVLDFGICISDEQSKMRCLTLLNLSDTPVTVSLFSHSPAIQIPSLIRVAPHSANTVEVCLLIAENGLQADFTGLVDVICPEFQSTMLQVKAFIGQPVFMLSWDYAFFNPCRIGQSHTISMQMVNVSEYEISAFMSGFERVESKDENGVVVQRNYFQTSFSTSCDDPVKIPPHSVLPVNFHFHAVQRGPLLKHIQLHLLTPTKIDFPINVFMRPLYLVGVCIEPYMRKENERSDYNGIDFLRQWLSHPRRLQEEYPELLEDVKKIFQLDDDISYPSRVNARFKYESFTLRPQAIPSKHGLMAMDLNYRKTMVQRTELQNVGIAHEKIVFLCPSNFTVDPRTKQIAPGTAEGVDLIFMPPDTNDIVTVHGFSAAVNEFDNTFSVISLVGKHRPLNFLTFPVFSSHTRDTIFDYGSIDKSVSNGVIDKRSLLLCNYSDVKYTWTIKFANSKTNFVPFEPLVSTADIEPNDVMAIPIQFKGDNCGSYEVSADVLVRETNDSSAKQIKVGTVLFRATCTSTGLIGIPESIDFGNTVIFHKRTRRFTVRNSGTVECDVTVIVKAPLEAFPRNFKLSKDNSREIVITYHPSESAVINSKIHIFANQMVYSVSVSGVGGTSSLICEKYDKKAIDFGVQKEDTICWADIYLTNNGSLPLGLAGISASHPDMVKIEYVGIVPTIPYESHRSDGAQDFDLHQDNWKIVKRKLGLIGGMKGHASKRTKKVHTPLVNHRSIVKVKGTQMNVRSSKEEMLNQDFTNFHVPPLKPFFSLRFRVGFSNIYQTRRQTSIVFHYLPITPHEEDEDVKDLLKSVELRATGATYRVLEFQPLFHDFGLAPAESYLVSRRQMGDSLESLHETSLGIVRHDGNTTSLAFPLNILNLGFEPQTLRLLSIAANWAVNERSWFLGPGEKCTIPVEFHPLKEQVQYHGEAVFSHKHGNAVVSLTGTGASAEVIVDEGISYGTLRMHVAMRKPLTISNRGLIGCKFYMTIKQNVHAFQFVSDEPFDQEGYLESGETFKIDVECECRSLIPPVATVNLRWQKVPRGQWEEMIVPLDVLIGQPIFKLPIQEFDFLTTFIKINKTIDVEIVNDGNASCRWSAVPELDVLVVEPPEGVLEPKSSSTLKVTFSPINFDPLRSIIQFITDDGNKIITCYGIVGVPYLKVEGMGKLLDFGIVELNKPSSRPIQLTNTGRRRIRYDVSLSNPLQDDIEVPLDEFDDFFVEPSAGELAPGETFTVSIFSIPHEYNAIVTCDVIIKTSDGERYSIPVSSIGGQAIIKIQAPQLIREPVNETASEDDTKPPNTNNFQVARIGMMNHIDCINDLLRQLNEAYEEEQKLVEVKNSDLHAMAQFSALSPIAEGSNQDQNDISEETTDSFPVPRRKSVADMILMKRNMKKVRRKSMLRRPSVSDGGDETRTAPVDFKAKLTDLEAVIKPLQQILAATSEMMHGLTYRIQNDADALSKDIDDEILAVINKSIVETSTAALDNVREAVKEVAGQQLEDAINRLQQSVNYSQSIVEKKPAFESAPKLSENNLHLGLIRGDTRSDPRTVFHLPNSGNMAFGFTIVEKKDYRLTPLDEKDENSKAELFEIFPKEGTIQPEEIVEVVVTFKASVTGLYQQGFDVMGNGQKLFFFSVSANVGNAILVVEPQNIDFGIVLKGRESKKAFTIKNIGNLFDKISVENVVSNDFDKVKDQADDNPLSITEIYREVAAGDSTEIDVWFRPKLESTFTHKIQVSWSKEPINISLRGIGGYFNLLPTYLDESDIKFRGLEFGESLVGHAYQKEFVVKNVGLCAAEFSMLHPSPIVTFTAEIEEEGIVKLAPEEQTKIKVLLTPVESILIQNPLVFEMMDGSSITIPLRAHCGSRSFNVDNQLRFSHMGINEVQERYIAFKNVGDFTIPLSFSLETVDPSIAMLQSVDRPNTGSFVKPGEEVKISLTYSPLAAAKQFGKIIVKTDLGRGEESFFYDYQFVVYKKRVALDNEENESTGRITLGEEATILRTISNYGDTRIHYRTALEIVNPDKSGKSKPPELWEIVEGTEGFLGENDVDEIKIIFKALAAGGDRFHEAIVHVEASEDDKKWTTVAKFTISGAVGKSKLVVATEKIDFGIVAVAQSKEKTFFIQNDGNALMSYEILIESKDDVFRLVDDAVAKLEPENSRELIIAFSPGEEQNYSATLVIKTQLETKSLPLTGFGALFRLMKETIPDVMDFGSLLIGTETEKTFSIGCDCGYPVEVDITFEGSGANDFSVLEPSFTLTEPSKSSGKKTVKEIKIKSKLFVPFLNSGEVDFNAITEIVQDCPSTRMMIQTPSQQYSIILKRRAIIRPLEFVLPNGDVCLSQSETVDFGEVNMTAGKTLNLTIRNSNYFRIPVEMEYPESQFFIDPNPFVIPELGETKVQLALLRYMAAEADDIPATLPCNSTIVFKPPAKTFKLPTVLLSGILVDVPDELKFEVPFDFGSVFTSDYHEVELTWRNPVRRPLPYKLSIEESYSDIFEIVGDAEGSASSRQSLVHKIRFKPKMSNTYTAFGSLETEEGKYPFEIRGVGIEPRLKTSTTKLDFGVVGTNAAEFRVVEVMNTSTVTLKMMMQSTNEYFVVEPNELELAPQQARKIKVIFKPRNEGDEYVGEIQIQHITTSNHEMQRVLCQIKTRGIGGKFEIQLSGDVAARQANRVVDEVSQDDEITTSIEIENSGETEIEVEATVFQKPSTRPATASNIPGRPISGHKLGQKDGPEVENAEFAVRPASAVIRPKSKQSFEVVMKGKEPGEVHASLVISTKNLDDPEKGIIEVPFTARIISSAKFRAIQTFVNADTSLLEKTDMKRITETEFNSDEMLWKVLAPVIRISKLKPSEDALYLPNPEPYIADIDISALLVRPPPVPKDPPKSKRMTNFITSHDRHRMSLRVQQRAQEATEFFRPVEKYVNLSKRK